MCLGCNPHSGALPSEVPYAYPAAPIYHIPRYDKPVPMERQAVYVGDHWELLPVERVVGGSMFYWAVHWRGCVNYIPDFTCSPLPWAGVHWPYSQAQKDFGQVALGYMADVDTPDRVHWPAANCQDLGTLNETRNGHEAEPEAHPSSEAAPIFTPISPRASPSAEAPTDTLNPAAASPSFEAPADMPNQPPASPTAEASVEISSPVKDAQAQDTLAAQDAAFLQPCNLGCFLDYEDDADSVYAPPDEDPPKYAATVKAPKNLKGGTLAYLGNGHYGLLDNKRVLPKHGVSELIPLFDNEEKVINEIVAPTDEEIVSEVAEMVDSLLVESVEISVVESIDSPVLDANGGPVAVDASHVILNAPASDPATSTGDVAPADENVASGVAENIESSILDINGGAEPADVMPVFEKVDIGAEIEVVRRQRQYLDPHMRRLGDKLREWEALCSSSLAVANARVAVASKRESKVTDLLKAGLEANLRA